MFKLPGRIYAEINILGSFEYGIASEIAAPHGIF